MKGAMESGSEPQQETQINFEEILDSNLNSNPKIVVIMGATGSGKSKLAIDLASHFPIEIINADSMQVILLLSIESRHFSSIGVYLYFAEYMFVCENLSHWHHSRQRFLLIVFLNEYIFLYLYSCLCTYIRLRWSLLVCIILIFEYKLQVYNGLDVLTNKVPLQDQKGSFPALQTL